MSSQIHQNYSPKVEATVWSTCICRPPTPTCFRASIWTVTMWLWKAYALLPQVGQASLGRCKTSAAAIPFSKTWSSPPKMSEAKPWMPRKLRGPEEEPEPGPSGYACLLGSAHTNHHLCDFLESHFQMRRQNSSRTWVTTWLTSTGWLVAGPWLGWASQVSLQKAHPQAQLEASRAQQPLRGTSTSPWCQGFCLCLSLQPLGTPLTIIEPSLKSQTEWKQ